MQLLATATACNQQQLPVPYHHLLERLPCQLPDCFLCPSVALSASAVQASHDQKAINEVNNHGVQHAAPCSCECTLWGVRLRFVCSAPHLRVPPWP